MSDVHRQYEIRCPIHGFIGFNDWERTVIAHPVFQRLRRIRQLAWTEFIYPGATHTRFEHSLGVMHLASRIYDALVRDDQSQRVLIEDLNYDEIGFKRDRQLLRFAALLHDVGHGPLSHASEDLMPFEAAGGRRFTHEQYSAAIIRTQLKDAIEKHPLNDNCGLRADDIADFLEGKSTLRRAVFWRELLDGQIDADRMDYLLRDSHHAGVQYGRYDLERIIATVTIAKGAEMETDIRLGVTEGGFHAAESIVLARYFMFTQVYFHKTRVAYDIVLRRLLKTLLPGGVFPKPDAAGLSEYLKWDDWRVLGEVARGNGGEEGRMLLKRDHFRSVFATPELSTKEDFEQLQKAEEKLEQQGIERFVERAGKSWYKTGAADIPIVDKNGHTRPLSAHSGIVAKMQETNQTRIFVRPGDAGNARKLLEEVARKGDCR